MSVRRRSGTRKAVPDQAHADLKRGEDRRPTQASFRAGRMRVRAPRRLPVLRVTRPTPVRRSRPPAAECDLGDPRRCRPRKTRLRGPRPKRGFCDNRLVECTHPHAARMTDLLPPGVRPFASAEPIDLRGLFLTAATPSRWTMSSALYDAASSAGVSCAAVTMLLPAAHCRPSRPGGCRAAGARPGGVSALSRLGRFAPVTRVETRDGGWPGGVSRSAARRW